VENIGELLKELRIKKGLSIEDIQEITKIRSRYIQAIEEGNLDKLPGQFYAKAFIKAYAEVVELDPAVLAEYQESIPTPKLDEIPIKANMNSMANSPSKLGKWFAVSLVYILIGLVLLFGYMLYVTHSSNPSEEDSRGNPFQDRMDVTQDDEETNPDHQAEPMPTDTPEKEEIKINKLTTETFKGRQKDAYEVLADPEEPINIQLKFTDRCWFSIKTGGYEGKEFLTGTKNAGEETEVFPLNNEEILIHLGNAAGADIFVNDQKIDVGEVSDPKYISIIRMNQ